MAYTPATIMPNALAYFQWSRPSAENPRLASPISATDTTIVFTNPPKHYDGTIISQAFLFGIRNEQGYVESCLCPAGGLSVDGLTATGVVRGIRLDGLDYTTGDATLASAFNQDSPVFCQVSGVNFSLMISALNGTIASGGTNWKIGDGTDSDIKIYGYNADVNKPYWGYDKTTNQWIFSNDGVSSTPFGTGAGVTGGAGITVAAGDISVDLTDTAVFKATSAGAGDAGKASIFNASGLLNQSIIEVWKDVTATSSELNKLHGINATVTTAAFNTVLADSTTNADAYHTHVNSYPYTSVISWTKGTTDGNWDTTVTCGFRPRLIEINYKMIGINNGNENYSVGVAQFDATSVRTNVVYAQDAAVGSTLTVGTCTMSSVNPSAGSSGAVNGFIGTLSVSSVTDTTCVVRFNTTKVGIPAADKTSTFVVKCYR